MPKTSTVGKILLQQHVPEALKSHIESTVLDSKGLGDFFDKASREHPVEYKDMVSQLTRLGFEVSTRLGSTVSLQDLVSPIDKDKKFAELEKKIEQLDATEKDAKRHKIALSKLFSDFTKEVETELVEVGVKKNQTLAKVIRAGARGKPMQYRQTVFSPILVNDAKDQPLTDFIIKNSYAEGLTLPEYLIGSFGARKGEVSKKLAVAEAGYFSKQLTRVGMVVKVEETDCGTHNGIPASTEDKDSVGCFLAHPVGSYHRNNEVTSSMLNDLKNKGIKSFVIRSVITCESSAKFHSGAVCQLCLGKRDHKNGTPIGSYVGITAANTIGEPLCLAKGTLVKMADFSSKPIEEVKVGEEILGADVTGKTFRTKVVNTFANGVRKCRTFNFQYSGAHDLVNPDNRVSVTCTDAHKVLARNGRNLKLEVREISKSISRVWSPATASGFDGTGLQKEEYSLLLGLLFGDGCTTSKNLHFSCADPLLIEDATSYLHSLGVTFSGEAENVDFYIAKHTGLLEKVKEYNLLGKYSFEKELSPSMQGWDNASIAAFISGLVSTDGCLSLAKHGKPIIDITSTSRPLLLAVRDLLYWRFGLDVCAPYLAYAAGKKKNKFSKKLNRTIKSKRDCYALRVSSRSYVQCLLSHLSLVGEKRKSSEVWLAQEKLWQSSHIRPARFTIVDTSDYFDAETYDLEVEHKDHLFCLANGLIVSNSQGQLNVKHTSGTAGGAHISSGFKLINNLANIPKLFPYEATLAEKDGTITDIRAAPQGGHYVHLAGKEYYTPSGYELTHKVGDHVEAGDALCSGIVNPAKIVLHKGVGEGRRYFAEATKKAFDDAGMGGINRRNFELMARGVIDHVKITNNEGLGDHLPGEIVHYQTLAKNYVHRPDSKTVRVDQAYDKYLEQPVLHYTIGDRITKSRIQQLKEHGIESILVNDKAPDFEPEMQRLLGVPIHEHDWMHQLYSTNLERRLVQAVNTGASSDLKGASPIAGLAYGVDFGKKHNGVKQAEFTTDEEENTEEPLSFE